MTIDFYRQLIYFEGKSPEEALAIVGAEKVTDEIVLWGDETDEYKAWAEEIIERYGDKITNIYTEEDKAEYEREKAELEAKLSMTTPETDYRPGSPLFMKVELISKLIHTFDIADCVYVEVEDAFLDTYYNLPELDKKVADMLMEGASYGEIASEIKNGYPVIRETRERIRAKLSASIEEHPLYEDLKSKDRMYTSLPS